MKACRSVSFLRTAALSAMFVSWSPAASSAQIVGTGQTVPGQIDDRAVITLEVRDRPLEDVLEHIRTKVGITIVTAPGTEGRVTIKLRYIPWRESLELVAENAGCIVTDQGNNLFKVEQPPRVTMAFSEVPIRQVIESIAKAADANIVVSERVTGNVTMVISNKPWRDALDAVVKTNGFFIVEEDRGIIRVVDKDGLATHVERRLFRLKYLRPKNTYVAKIETSYAEGKQKGATNDPVQDFPLLRALQGMLSAEGKLDYFADENSILVLDTKPVLTEIESFVTRLDVEPVQVYIDVKFISTSDTNTHDYAFGVDNGINALMTGASRKSRYPFDPGKGSYGDAILPGTRPEQEIGTLKKLGVSPGILDFTATSIAIRLIKTDISARVVQAPRITTLNHKAATIFVGETVRYAQADATTNQSGGLQLTVKEAQNSPVQTGFQLWVLPHVVPGTNKIMMSVIPEAETLTGITHPDLPGFDLFEVGAGTTGEGSIALPRVGSQSVVVEMMLENGETGIVGGLTQTERRKENTKVPLLGDIPLLGWLFKSQTARDDERGLLVFLTPWIVRSTDQVDEGLNKIIERHKENSGLEWDRLAAEASGT